MGNKDSVEKSNVKQPSLGRAPTKLVLTSPSQYKGVQQIENRSKDIHLRIMYRSDKAYIPLIRVTR
jgi:hypothetical protein